MKVVSASTMAGLESLAYQQGCREEDFMEKAGEGVARITQEFISSNQLPKSVLLLCGKGNNGGDAFVAGRYLLRQGIAVTALIPENLENCSPLCKLNGRRLFEQNGILYSKIEDIQWPAYGVILDGFFGTGFKGKVKEPYRSIIQAANQSRKPILAIDIPSGLNGTTGEIEGACIQATQTIFLGLPKTGFFLRDGWNTIGRIRHVDFGLPRQLIDEVPEDLILISPLQAAKILPVIKRNRHKYEAGYVIGLAGSPGMPGAALMSCLAAFRGGSGMVRLLHPEGMQAELAGSPYELIKIPYQSHESDKVLQEMQKAGATFIGPGLGKTDSVRNLLKHVVPSLEKPVVLDADALTIYSEDGFDLPPKAILTPHLGEMQKLLHQEEHLVLTYDLLKQCQEYAEEKKITLVLKGAPTFIFHPGEKILANPTGDPGMATAGSGDVLTGLIASLLSQGLGNRDAAALGVFLHGLAGEFAADKTSSYGLMATDLINYFWQAFQLLQKVRSLM